MARLIIAILLRCLITMRMIIQIVLIMTSIMILIMRLLIIILEELGGRNDGWRHAWMDLLMSACMDEHCAPNCGVQLSGTTAGESIVPDNSVIPR